MPRGSGKGASMLMYPGRNGAPPVGGGSKLRGKRANTRGSSDSCAARLFLFLARERFETSRWEKSRFALHSAPRQHSASQHSPRQTSDAGFEAHILKAERRLHAFDIVSQPSRTFESRVRAETRPTSGGHCLNGGCEFMTANRAVLRAKRATETSKRAFSTRPLWTSDEASQPRTFESPRARRVAQDKRALVARQKRLGNKPKK